MENTTKNIQVHVDSLRACLCAQFVSVLPLIALFAQDKYSEVFDKFKTSFEAQKTSQMATDLDSYAKFEERLHERPS